MKLLAKDIYIKRDGEYSYVLSHKKVHQKGKHKGEEYYSLIGYYSNMERVWHKIEDLGYSEFVNRDFQECRVFMIEISNAVIDFIKSQKKYK